MVKLTDDKARKFWENINKYKNTKIGEDADHE